MEQKGDIKVEKFHDKEGAGPADEAVAGKQDQGLAARYEWYRSHLKDFTIMNDIFMRNVFKKRDDWAVKYNVEVQQDNEGASPERARYHSGLMDMNTRMEGQAFEELPESYVIFITHSDVLGYGLPIYHINRKIEEVLSERVRELKETQKDFLSGEVGLFYRR